MKPVIFFKLSLMMFLQYFIWGAWYVTLGIYMSTYLGASGTQIGAAYGALAIATMISPFFVGLVADKYFASQRIMSILHITGALLLFLATRIEDNTVFYWVILLYSLLYMPTIALSNSIAFNQMTDPGKEFPWIRVFGTLGWIASGVCIGLLSIEKTATTFYMATAISAFMGLICWILPHTPPKGAQKVDNKSDAPSTDSLVLLKNKPYLIFFIASILVCIPLSFYYSFANVFLNDLGMESPASKMVLGQMSEAIFILAIPFLFYRIGVKKMILVGVGAWILRYVFFAFGNMESQAWMLYAGIILHGICYDFFFVTGYMYTEKKANEKIKNAAQGLFTFATYGLGMFFGTWFSGKTVDHYSLEGIHNWKDIWFVPAYIGVAVIIYFILFFKEDRKIQATE